MTKKANASSACFSVLFIAAFTLFALSAQAQLLIGPRIGGQISWVQFDDKNFYDIYETKPVPGFSGGFTLGFKVEKRFFLQTDFVYSRKGKILEGKLDPLLEYHLINHHFDIPITYRVDFKGSIGDGQDFKWFLGLGPNISYWWKGNGTIKSTELAEYRVEEREFEIEFDADISEAGENVLVVSEPNRVQLGINFASGIVLEPAGGNTIIIDFRFELGHTYQSKKDVARFPDLVEFADPVKARTMALKIGVSYLFDTKIAERKKGKSTGKGK